jgi:hypothetical protein
MNSPTAWMVPQRVPCPTAELGRAGSLALALGLPEPDVVAGDGPGAGLSVETNSPVSLWHRVRLEFECAWGRPVSVPSGVSGGPGLVLRASGADRRRWHRIPGAGPVAALIPALRPVQPYPGAGTGSSAIPAQGPSEPSSRRGGRRSARPGAGGTQSSGRPVSSRPATSFTSSSPLVTGSWLVVPYEHELDGFLSFPQVARLILRGSSSASQPF